MGLFSTLLATSSGKYNPSDEGLATVTTTASSLSLPTIIQMFTDKPFELDLSPTRSQIPSYANLSYQAVPVNPTADPASSNAEPSAGLRKQQNPLLSTVPELGIWNCRVNVPHLSPNPSSGTTGAATLVDSLLDIPVKSCKTARAFCFKVDVSRPEMVEPTLTALQEALVRYLIQSQDYSSTATSDVSTSSTATTTLYQLRMVQFGLATGEDKNDSIKAAPEERDRAVKLTLQIAVVWPKLTGVVPDNDSYRNQQTMALLYYHLRRYAAALNASLLFVRPVTSTTAEEGMGGSVTEPSTMDLLQPTINIAQLGAIWRALVQGKAVWNSEVWSEVLELSLRTPVTPQVENEEGSSFGNNSDSTTALVYGPDAHAEDWIESGLLRNAQYPGFWDAEKDSIWKVLPAPNSIGVGDMISSTVGGGGATVGDEAWLQELRASVATAMESTTTTVAGTPGKGQTAATEMKSPDVSDYFASLMKK